MTKLNEAELLYALALLNIFKGRNSSIKTGELRIRHPSNVIAWLEEKELLITVVLEAEKRLIERRTVLGMRALNFLEAPCIFGNSVKMLEEINNEG